MSTAVSSTETAHHRRVGYWQQLWRATVDVGPLLRFRTSSVRGRSRTGVVTGFAFILVVTVLVCWLPAYLPTGDDRRSDVLLLLSTGYLGVLAIAIIAAAASGGGRELLPRDQAVAYPVSPTTDHLGALLMAPLNIAWLLQSWALLGATSYVVGPKWEVLLALVPVFLWLLAATALAQIIAWTVEWLRRGVNGINVIRFTNVLLTAALAALIVTSSLVPLLDRSPTVRITLTVLAGANANMDAWFQGVAGLVGLAVAAIVLGAWLANAVTRRPARDEVREETSVRPPRENPASDLMAVLRVDRVGVWRSVPLRRGLAVLSLLPGLVALAGGLDWFMLPILPGLVASGGALLFGVNLWCLDGRGALWRDSLPADPRLAFTSRALVLGEMLLLSLAATLLLAAIRAGTPTLSQLVGVVVCTVVVTVQVVATCLRWSVTHPFSVDLRSARATPAPPVVMVGYSAKLALSTTLTGMTFGAATFAGWEWSVLLAIPFLLFSSAKIVGAASSWAQPELRSRVVATVAS